MEFHCIAHYLHLCQMWHQFDCRQNPEYQTIWIKISKNLKLYTFRKLFTLDMTRTYLQSTILNIKVRVDPLMATGWLRIVGIAVQRIVQKKMWGLIHSVTIPMLARKTCIQNRLSWARAPRLCAWQLFLALPQVCGKFPILPSILLPTDVALFHGINQKKTN